MAHMHRALPCTANPTPKKRAQITRLQTVLMPKLSILLLQCRERGEFLDAFQWSPRACIKAQFFARVVRADRDHTTFVQPFLDAWAPRCHIQRWMWHRVASSLLSILTSILSYVPDLHACMRALLLCLHACSCSCSQNVSRIIKHGLALLHSASGHAKNSCFSPARTA